MTAGEVAKRTRSWGSATLNGAFAHTSASGHPVGLPLREGGERGQGDYLGKGTSVGAIQPGAVNHGSRAGNARSSSTMREVEPVRCVRSTVARSLPHRRRRTPSCAPNGVPVGPLRQRLPRRSFGSAHADRLYGSGEKRFPRRAHNPETAGSTPVAATNAKTLQVAGAAGRESGFPGGGR